MHGPVGNTCWIEWRYVLKCQVGNMMFWFIFCIFGQPMCVLLYYHDLMNRGGTSDWTNGDSGVLFPPLCRLNVRDRLLQWTFGDKVLLLHMIHDRANDSVYTYKCAKWNLSMPQLLILKLSFSLWATVILIKIYHLEEDTTFSNSIKLCDYICGIRSY